MAIDKGIYAGSVFVDLTQAFDKINQHILSFELESIGITSLAITLYKIT